ncbi:hypothetical protein [Methylomonas sp. HYX-M1]|uniref:hypothetical protein n=1 Tax=Methylomonas sp. HYX-M1 TaxID=3139307 RepID=UPI00345B79F8
MKIDKLAMTLLAASASLQANATNINDLLLKQSPALLSDNSAEYLINVDDSVNAAGGATLTKGDILFAIVGFNSIGGTNIGSGTSINELTAFAAVKVMDGRDVDLGPLGPDDQDGPQNVDLWQYRLGALEANDRAYFDWSTGNILGGMYTFDAAKLGAQNDGIFVGALYEDSANDYGRDGFVQDGINSATNGELRLTLGLSGPNDYFSSIAPLNVDEFLSVAYATAITNTNLGFQVTVLNATFPGLDIGKFVTGGNGGLSRPSGDSEFPIFDNLDWTIIASQPNPPLPEPTSLALLVIGVLSMAVYSRQTSVG